MQSLGDCAFLRFLLDLGVFDAELDLALFPYVLNYHFYQFCPFEPGSSELRATVRPSVEGTWLGHVDSPPRGRPSGHSQIPCVMYRLASDKGAGL